MKTQLDKVTLAYEQYMDGAILLSEFNAQVVALLAAAAQQQVDNDLEQLSRGREIAEQLDKAE